MDTKIAKQNRFFFSIGTLGRDMVYAIITMFLMYYLTDIIQLEDNTLLQITIVMFFARIFDALNDPVMGTIVDNTRTRFGKFKPWIFIGVVLSGIFTALIFTDFGVVGSKYVLLFAVLYVGWGVSYTMNDIAYWSMLPALSTSQKEREQLGSLAKIFANIGLFGVVVGVDPITRALGAFLEKQGYENPMVLSYKLFAFGLVIFMIIFQAFTLWGVKEPPLSIQAKNKHNIGLSGMFKAIIKNDQLLSIAGSMILFMIGYTTTTNFGLYFFKYAYGNQNMYSIYAAILGISQLSALAVFPLLTKKHTRKQLYTLATFGVALGYILFLVSPMHMGIISIAGVFIFFCESLVQLLCLVFLADTVEYGQWKLGVRNESITFSIQPFIYKLSGGIAAGITGGIVILSGINQAQSAADMTTQGLWIMKITMLVFPLILFIFSYIVYAKTFKIDSKLFDTIINDLQQRNKPNDE